MARAEGQMGDEIFRAQLRLVQERFAEQGITVVAVPDREGGIDYIYAEGQIVARSEVVPELQRYFDVEILSPDRNDGLMVLGVPGGSTVPEFLDRARDAIPGRRADFKENSIVSLTGVRMCQGTEPEVPCCADPCPPLVESSAGKGVLIGVSDTGLVEIPPSHPWLAGVTGEPDAAPAGVIPVYSGHGTFIAGLARGVAPLADVWVADHFPDTGATLESDLLPKLIDILDRGAQVISLSAGTHTREDVPLISTEIFWESHLRGRTDVVLLAAAGNNDTDRPFYPAAMEWAIAVGALGADRTHRAFFSNFGPWVDVWALGEGLVNAFGAGTYTYNEPPRAGAKQDFDRMARWSGTSFATPIVAGLVAGWLPGNPGATHVEVRAALRAAATPGTEVGPAVRADQPL